MRTSRDDTHCAVAHQIPNLEQFNTEVMQKPLTMTVNVSSSKWTSKRLYPLTPLRCHPSSEFSCPRACTLSLCAFSHLLGLHSWQPWRTNASTCSPWCVSFNNISVRRNAHLRLQCSWWESTMDSHLPHRLWWAGHHRTASETCDERTSASLPSSSPPLSHARAHVWRPLLHFPPPHPSLQLGYPRACCALCLGTFHCLPFRKLNHHCTIKTAKRIKESYSL